MKPLLDREYDDMIQQARKRNAEMEKTEADYMLAPPKHCDLRLHLRTVEQALKCAVIRRDWEVACEGIVLLQQAIARLTSEGSAFRGRHN
jgi:hypothetical protein